MTPLASDPELGPELGRGLRSTVYAWGSDSVIKVPLEATPDEWTDYEFAYARSAVMSGVSAPVHRKVVSHAGRRCTIAARVWGRSMMEELAVRPSLADELARQLGQFQRSLFAAVPSLELPRQQDRLTCKIRRGSLRFDLDPAPLLAFVAAAMAGAEAFVLCHGDLHPRNLLLADEGVVAIDWFDASRGLPIAEFARTSVLLDYFGSVELSPELASVDPMAFAKFGATYRAWMQQAMSFDPHEVARWEHLQRVARVSEGFDLDGPDELRLEQERLF